MPCLLRILTILPVILVTAHAQGVIKSAQGTNGSPASAGLQVLQNGKDANIINQTEITANIVNECGRTLLNGNIDIGQNTEDLIANKSITSVTKGSKVAVAIDQGGNLGAGPYSCDVDLTSNSNGATGQTNLTAKETDGSAGTINLAVSMPNDLACTGASTGNICTVRCFNANNFGGCFAVEQTDVTPKKNTVSNIATKQALSSVLDQVLDNQKDLSASMQANHEAENASQQGTMTADALVKINSRAIAAVSLVLGRRAAREFFA